MLRPILHFFVLGGVAFVVAQATDFGEVARSTAAPAFATGPVIVDDIRRAQLAEDWRALADFADRLFFGKPTERDFKQAPFELTK